MLKNKVPKIFQQDYLFSTNNRKILEDNLNAKFLLDIDPGLGCLFSLFYSEKPDTSKGHKHYVFVRSEGVKVYISASELTHVTGILEDDVFYYSSHRHDFVKTPKGQFIDGGTYYTKTSCDTVIMSLESTGPTIKDRKNHD